MEKLFILHQNQDQLSLLGPYNLSELKTALKNQEIVASDFVYRPTYSEKWVRICDVPEFRERLLTSPTAKEFEKFARTIHAHASALPGTPLQAEALDTSPTKTALVADRKAPWYFKFEGYKYGPFATRQITEIINLRRLGQKKLDLWHRSAKEWFPATELNQFGKKHPELMVDDDHYEVDHSSNKRAQPRSPQVAGVWAMIEKKVRLVGISTDISLTGAQLVHHAKMRIDMESRVNVYIDPPEVDGYGFWVVARVVRVATGGNRLGLHFDAGDDLTGLRHWLSRPQETSY